MSGKSPPKEKMDIEQHPDAWERFERAVDIVGKSPPQHRSRDGRAAADQSFAKFAQSCGVNWSEYQKPLRPFEGADEDCLSGDHAPQGAQKRSLANRG